MAEHYILIVDDDPGLVKFVRANLRVRGYQTAVAMDGNEALNSVEEKVPDLIVLDINLPGVSGFDVCQQIREWSQVPIIMLSARIDESDKVKALDIGADDYIVKPFGIDELLARVRAVLRRRETTPSESVKSVFVSGDLKVNFADRRVTVGGHEIKLTPTEYNVLKQLVINAGKVLTHSMLLKIVWGSQYQDEKEYLHVIINRLRSKLEPDVTSPSVIITVPGVGYRFETHH